MLRRPTPNRRKIMKHCFRAAHGVVVLVATLAWLPAQAADLAECARGVPDHFFAQGSHGNRSFAATMCDWVALVDAEDDGELTTLLDDDPAPFGSFVTTEPVRITPIPEPGTVAMTLLGIAAVAAVLGGRRAVRAARLTQRKALRCALPRLNRVARAPLLEADTEPSCMCLFQGATP
jgi:PEP-CTERM motif